MLKNNKMGRVNFELTIEPKIPKAPTFMWGLEGLLSINVNGIPVLKTHEGTPELEQIFPLINWSIENFDSYTSEGMPKEMTPGVEIYYNLDDHSEYWDKFEVFGKPAYSFPKKGKEKFNHWLSSHAFGYPYFKLPIIFQRRKDLMEVSWRFDNDFYANRNGCEYVPLDMFKKEIRNSIVKVVKEIEDSGKITDYSQYCLEFKEVA